ncbi:uncharacterized protein LOC127247812 [Andrographis paniculata]|uniref:uncharacterized protein LOC127247812 n=1 Tax=Andrographis paniculata TaxID=175694 RepID=UPI0021E7F33E|nr:uncharacterized protein LOC127247812 [Andrographis paniculata]
MAQQQHILSGGGGGRSKSGKPKKVPQRGLGVAQLEKIRLEEQRKKEALESSAIAINPCLDVHFPLQIGSNCNWNCKHFVNGDNGGDNKGPILPQFHLLPQKSHQLLHSFTQISSPLPPKLSSQKEPPSNQSSNIYTHPDDNRQIIGMKRPCPFPLQQHHVHRRGKFSDESSSCSTNDREAGIEINYPRDRPWNSSSFLSIDSLPGKLNADFLSLAPPSASPCDEELKHRNLDESSGGSIELFAVKCEVGGKEDAIDLNLKL